MNLFEIALELFRLISNLIMSYPKVVFSILIGLMGLNYEREIIKIGGSIIYDNSIKNEATYPFSPTSTAFSYGEKFTCFDKNYNKYDLEKTNKLTNNIFVDRYRTYNGKLVKLNNMEFSKESSYINIPNERKNIKININRCCFKKNGAIYESYNNCVKRLSKEGKPLIMHVLKYSHAEH